MGPEWASGHSYTTILRTVVLVDCLLDGRGVGLGMAREGWRPSSTPGMERYWNGKRWTEERPVQSGPDSSSLYRFVVGMQPTSEVTIWEGHKRNLTNAATGGALVGASYRVTEDALYFQSGVVSTRAEVIPLWAVLDIDMRQGPTQKARGVGDLLVRLDVSNFRYGQNQVTLESIEKPLEVRGLISYAGNVQRKDMLERLHSLEIEQRRAGASAFHMQGTGPGLGAAPSASQDQILEQLKQLVELKVSGILTEEEFVAQKRRLLNKP